MNKIFAVFSLALGGLCLISCDNKDKTVAELTGKLLDAQTRLGALENLQNRVNVLESVAQKVAMLEAAEKRVAALEKLCPRVSSLESIGSRVESLESLESRIVALETLPSRLRMLEKLTDRVVALETLPARMGEMEKLAARVAVLEERLKAQADAMAKAHTPDGSEAKKPGPLQQAVELMETYGIVKRTGENSPTVFLSHVARIEHGDAAITDYFILHELFETGSESNPIPLSCVKVFVEAGADAKEVNNEGRTVLMEACTQCDPLVVRYVMERGVDVNAADSEGVTALMEAVSAGSVTVVRSLLEAGADAKKEDANGEDALVRILAGTMDDSSCAELVRILCTAGCDVNKAARGATPLWLAVQAGAPDEVIETLVNMGADVTIPDAEGQTLREYLAEPKATSAFGRRISDHARDLLLGEWEKAAVKKALDATETTPAPEPEPTAEDVPAEDAPAEE